MGLFDSISNFVKEQAGKLVESVQDYYEKSQINSEFDLQIQSLRSSSRFGNISTMRDRISELKKNCTYNCKRMTTATGHSLCVSLNCKNMEVKSLESQIQNAQRKNSEIEKKIQELEEKKKQNIEIYEKSKKKELEKKLVENDDMKRMEQIIKTTIPQKKSEISNFNARLKKSIETYIQKANQAVEIAYGKVLDNTNYNQNEFYKMYDTIYKTNSFKVNPTIMSSCDTTVKKLTNLIKQKEDLIAKNNSAIEKYSELSAQLQQKYADEYAIQQIKHLNRGINSEIENSSDIAKGEENTLLIHNLIGNVELLNREIEERRNIEIELGTIEI